MTALLVDVFALAALGGLLYFQLGSIGREARINAQLDEHIRRMQHLQNNMMSR